MNRSLAIVIFDNIYVHLARDSLLTGLPSGFLGNPCCRETRVLVPRVPGSPVLLAGTPRCAPLGAAERVWKGIIAWYTGRSCGSSTSLHSPGALVWSCTEGAGERKRVFSFSFVDGPDLHSEMRIMHAIRSEADRGSNHSVLVYRAINKAPNVTSPQAERDCCGAILSIIYYKRRANGARTARRGGWQAYKPGTWYGKSTAGRHTSDP